MSQDCWREQELAVNKNKEIVFRVPSELTTLISKLRGDEIVRGRALSMPGSKVMRLDLLFERKKTKPRKCNFFSKSTKQIASVQPNASCQPPGPPPSADVIFGSMDNKMNILEKKLDFLLNEMGKLGTPCKAPKDEKKKKKKKK